MLFKCQLWNIVLSLFFSIYNQSDTGNRLMSVESGSSCCLRTDTITRSFKSQLEKRQWNRSCECDHPNLINMVTTLIKAKRSYFSLLHSKRCTNTFFLPYAAVCPVEWCPWTIWHLWHPGRAYLMNGSVRRCWNWTRHQTSLGPKLWSVK